MMSSPPIVRLATSVLAEIEELISTETNRARYVQLLRAREQATALLTELAASHDSDAA